MTSEHIFKCPHPNHKHEYLMTYETPCLYCQHDTDKHTHTGDKEKIIFSHCSECSCMIVWLNQDKVKEAYSKIEEIYNHVNT